MQLVYEMGRTENVRAVLCLEENVVTGAADGYARTAGKPAFTLLHVGSGFANGLANIHNAGRANTTMVNIVGANATYHQPNFAEHDLINSRVVDLARVVSHWAHQAKSASDLAVLGAMAARYSRIGAGKICTVVAPTVVVMKNDSYGILNIELARVREGEPNKKCSRCCTLTTPRWTG